MQAENENRTLTFLSGCIRAMEALAAESPSVSLPRALKLLGESAAIDRVNLQRFDYSRTKTRPSVEVVAEWRSEPRGDDECGGHDDAAVGNDWDSNWYDEFLEDRIVQTPESELFDTGAHSRNGRMRSVVAIPVDVDGDLWGFLRLDFARTEIYWTDEHEAISRILTRCLGLLLSANERRSVFHEPISLSLEQLGRENEIAFQLDSRGRWTFLSPAWDRLTGFSAQRALGSHHSMYLFRYRNGAGSEMSPIDLLDGISTEQTRAGEGLLKADDGSHVWVSFVVAPIPVAAQGDAHFQGLLVDIRDKKAQEHRELSSAKQLQEKNTELLTALMAAQEATRSKGRFLATMSHEIRTPLNGVLGMTSLLLQTSLDRQQREYTRAIQSSAESLLSIVNSVLDYSKLEAQGVELEEVFFDPRQLVEDVFSHLSEVASRKRIDLVVQTRFPMPNKVVGDPGKVKQVLTNLLGNAIKFSKKGEVCVRISWEPLLEPSGELRFEVIDYGIGIAPDTLRRLFRPFSQADPATSRIYGGTGLGLAICKQLTELMGGEITVQSQLGAGSRFQIALRTVGDEMISSGWVDAGEPGCLGAARALLVNLGETSQQVWSRALGECGVRVRRSSGLQEAIEILSTEDPSELTDIVIFDTQWLAGGSPEINRGIRLAAQNPHLQLVLLDSIHDAVDRSGLKGVEPLLVLRKPISPYRALETIATHRRLAQAPRKPIQRLVRVNPEAQEKLASALIFATEESRRKGLGFLFRRIGASAEAVDNFQDAIQRARTEPLSLIFLDADLGASTQLEAAQKLRSSLGAAAPPLVAVACSPQNREQLQQSGSFDLLLDSGFQREDLHRAVDQLTATGQSSLRASAS